MILIRDILIGFSFGFIVTFVFLQIYYGYKNKQLDKRLEEDRNRYYLSYLKDKEKEN